MCFIIRTEAHHQEAADDQDAGDPEEFEPHFGLERSSGPFGLAHTVNVADVSSEYRPIMKQSLFNISCHDGQHFTEAYPGIEVMEGEM